MDIKMGSADQVEKQGIQVGVISKYMEFQWAAHFGFMGIEWWGATAFATASAPAALQGGGGSSAVQDFGYC